MAATKKNEQKLDALAAFFDEGAYTELYADKDGAVAAGYGTAEGCPAYALAQNGGRADRRRRGEDGQGDGPGRKDRQSRRDLL